VRWGDAQEEAGFARNRFQEAFERDFLIKKFIDLIRRTKDGDKIRFPVEGEMLAERKRSTDFPHAQAFRRQFGGKSQIAAAILEHCQARSGFEVIGACEEVIKRNVPSSTREKESKDQESLGHVYLIKSGRYYKIGRTNAVGRRYYELAIQLPEKANTIHVIKTGSKPDAEMVNGLS
jgi:hypothetical protein